MITDIQETIERLKLTGKYKHILENVEKPTFPNLAFVFEMYFADEFTSYGHYLEYEENINQSNDKTIDFTYQARENVKFLFELVRPEMSEKLHSEYKQKLYRQGVTLSSNASNEWQRPEVQTIQLQEKIVDKVEKFPEPEDKFFSVIVVDCTNFHTGMFDDEDARMFMHGKTKKPHFQEYWNGEKSMGLLDSKHPAKNAPDFRRKVTAVIFIPELQAKNMISGAKIIFNSLRSKQHKTLFQDMSNEFQPISDLKWL